MRAQHRDAWRRQPQWRGLRLPARELEKSAVLAATAILNDQVAIATALQEGGAPTADINSVLKAAGRIVSSESGSQRAPGIARLVTRVDLRKGGMELSMDLGSLLPADGAKGTSLVFSRFVPLQMQRRGVAMRLVIGGHLSDRKVDLPLLRAVARGHKWFDQLVSARASHAAQIAAREGVNERYVRRLIPLAFLSPAIVEAITEGRQPASLTNEALSRGIDIPVAWDQQNAALGFE